MSQINNIVEFCGLHLYLKVLKCSHSENMCLMCKCAKKILSATVFTPSATVFTPIK